MRSMPLLTLAIGFVLLPRWSRADEPDAETDRSAVDERFDELTARLSEYRLKSDESAEPFVLVEKPVLRWSNPIRRTSDGGVFLWTSRGRAAAMMCAFWRNDREFKHEFQSLTAGPIEMKRDDATVWNPQVPGLQAAVHPSGIAVANSRRLRLTQMRRIAQEYAASVEDPNKKTKALRLLPQPLYRYGEQIEAPGIVDGAVFAYVESTDPEVLMVVEARDDSEGRREWTVAFARMSRWKQFVTYRDETVWSCDWIAGDATAPYVVLSYSTEEP